MRKEDIYYFLNIIQNRIAELGLEMFNENYINSKN